MRREVVTHKTVAEKSTVTECDRCGKPAQFLDWGTGLLIPVVEPKSRHYPENGFKWTQVKVDCCRECAEMLWRMFNCRGITSSEQKKIEGKS